MFHNNSSNAGQTRELQQVHSNGRPRVGLQPTDGQDAYKKASNRSSRRSRSERTSYLMATGHLDIEETQQLKESLPSIENIELKQNSNTSISISPSTKPAISGDQAYLDYAALSQLDSRDNIFSHDYSISSNLSKTKGLIKNTDNRGKFRRTYTEVTLPMKPSPAFEYMLKEPKRRIRRCCLWSIYSTLIAICIAIIVLCSTLLVLRYHNL